MHSDVNITVNTSTNDGLSTSVDTVTTDLDATFTDVSRSPDGTRTDSEINSNDVTLTHPKALPVCLEHSLSPAEDAKRAAVEATDTVVCASTIGAKSTAAGATDTAADISTDLANSAAVGKIYYGAGVSSDIGNSTIVWASIDINNRQICPDGEIITVDTGTESNIRITANVSEAGSILPADTRSDSDVGIKNCEAEKNGVDENPDLIENSDTRTIPDFGASPDSGAHVNAPSGDVGHTISVDIGDKKTTTGFKHKFWQKAPKQ